MKLFYINAESTEDEDIDGFVTAFTPESAFWHWRVNAVADEWIDVEDFESAIVIGEPAVPNDFDGARVFEIVTASSIGLLGWNHETSAGIAKLVGYVWR